MDETLEKLCVNGVLNLEHQYLEAKGLIHIPHMPYDYQKKWIRFIYSPIHKKKLWLEQHILIAKKMIHWIIGLPMLAKEKTTKTLSWVELEKKTLSEWDGRGMKINCVADMELMFHKIYSSN